METVESSLHLRSSHRPGDGISDHFSSVGAIYGLSLTVSIAVWLIAIRAPLWLDETLSFWQIHGSFSQIWSRGGGIFPAYSYILWLFTKVTGTSEIALRIPSVLAMLGAVYLLYRAARELFGSEMAMISSIVFCSHPIVIFAAIDIRPYAFAVSAVSASIFLLVRLRDNNSNWLPALFGISAAVILWFHILFGVILPALLCVFIAIKIADRKNFWRQVGIALASFAIAFLPVLPGVLYLFHTSGTHVFDDVPHAIDLLQTVAPGWQKWLFGLALLAIFSKDQLKNGRQTRPVVWCFLLAAIPLGILYGVSVLTSVHIFVVRYRLVAIPGIALCAGMIISRIYSQLLRVLLCVAVVMAAASIDLGQPIMRNHGFTWKYGLQAAEKSASTDNAPVLICSDLPESNYISMPLGSAKDSAILAPLTYYPLSVPVVPLPRALNPEAIRVSSAFLEGPGRGRFLAMAFNGSYATLDWIRNNTLKTHSARVLGDFDQVIVVEFVPLSPGNQGNQPSK